MDFEKAFDRLDREFLCSLTRSYAIPEKFVNLIRKTNEGMTCKVTHAGKVSAGLLESDKDVYYHHSCSCWLLTGLQERLQQTRETGSRGHCSPNWTTIIYGSCKRKHQTYTTILRSWGWTSTYVRPRSWGWTQQLNIQLPSGEGAAWRPGIV